MAALLAKGSEKGISPEPKVQSATPAFIVVVQSAGTDDPSNSSIYSTAPGDPIQAITGAVSSTTVTVASHVATFPAASYTSNTTVTSPTSEQPNVVCDAAYESTPQLSVEPPSSAEASIDALPEASKVTVTA